MPGYRDRQEAWRDRVRRWEQSGMGRAEFAAIEGVNASTLGWWRSELVKRDAAQRQGVVALARVTVTPDALSACTSPLEVVTRRGATVRVPVGFDAPTLGRLLAVLEERA